MDPWSPGSFFAYPQAPVEKQAIKNLGAIEKICLWKNKFLN